MFQKNDYDQAMYHFQQLLDRAPGGWIGRSSREVPRWVDGSVGG